MLSFLVEIIKNLFKKKEFPVETIPPVNPIPEIPTKEEVERFPSSFGIKKIAIIVGHGNGDSGAIGWNNVEEFDYNKQVAELVKNKTSKEIEVFYRSSTGIVGVAAKAVLSRPDMSIELHLNAYNGKAVGCEVLCLQGDTASGEVAKLFAKKFTQKFQRTLRRDNGVNWISSSDRGGTSLRAVAPIKYSILVEPFFIDTPSEWIHPGVYADFLIDYINAL